jgi:hypothetical protein
MGTNRLPKQALRYRPNGRRNLGRPRKRGTGNAVNIFISTVFRLSFPRSSHCSALRFANVSTDSELTLQLSCDKECECMKLRSFGIWRWGLSCKFMFLILGNPKNVSGWRYCSLLIAKTTVFNLTNPLNTSLSKCCNPLYRRRRRYRLL